MPQIVSEKINDRKLSIISTTFQSEDNAERDAQHRNVQC